jgi:hypothetical protein
MTISQIIGLCALAVILLVPMGAVLWDDCRKQKEFKRHDTTRNLEGGPV